VPGQNGKGISLSLVGIREMDCLEAQEVLSSYYDDEISDEMRSSLAEHVDSCRHCGEELSVFPKLSALVRDLDDPEPPDYIWPAITLRLDAETENAGVDVRTGQSSRLPRRWRVSVLATATLVMIVTGVVGITARRWHAPGHDHQLTADLNEYLGYFPSSPDGAQQILLAKYEGRAVNLAQAARHLGYRPATAVGLPKRYSLDAIYVLKMPCCPCVQSIYRCDDGEVFVVFEHDEQQPVWFGDRPRVSARFNGQRCDVVQIEDRLAVSWKEGNHCFTIVGVRDLDAIAILMTCLKASASQG